jgi:hypothetical protein
MTYWQLAELDVRWKQKKGDSMTQRRTNVAVFSFLGVILGILLAAYASYSTIGEFTLAMVTGGLFGGFVGANWTPASAQDHARRPRTTSK